MINYLWAGMILISFIAAMFTGNLESTANAAMGGATDAVQLVITLTGIMCLWTGLAKIGERAGLIKIMAKALSPLTRLIFPRLDQDSPAMRAIVMNMVANLLGMGNAATPLGLNAIKELDRINPRKGTATNEMCIFVVINTASLQLIPATTIALRQAAGSASPGIIIAPVWIASVLSLAAGVIAAKILERRRRL